jgi:hypothetical protein
MEKPQTGTIILIVGILAIVVFLYLNSPNKKVQPKSSSSQGTSTFAGLFSLGGAVVNAFSNKPQAPSSLPAYYGQGDSMSQASYALGHGVVEQQGNQLIDLNTGNPLVYGAE